jgi:Autotransporter beta-domain
LKDKSNIGFDFDYRKSPSLFASNALQGQQTDHLDQLLGRYNYADVAQLAVDRSADTFAATLSYNREINEHLQLYGDIYESYMGATVASGGVDAMPAEGFGTYATAQLIGTSLLKENDLYVTGLRYAKSSSSNQYELELGAKYPLTPEWRISPATRFGYKTFGSDGHTEFHFLPSVGLSYAISRNQSLEFDAGSHLTERFLGAGTEHEWEATLTVGYRYDFYSEN